MSDPHHGIFTLIESGDVAAVSSTLEQHPHLLTASGKYGWLYPGPPLHAAAWHDQPEVVKCLLGRGAALQAKARRGYTALHMAAWRGPDMSHIGSCTKSAAISATGGGQLRSFPAANIRHQAANIVKISFHVITRPAWLLVTPAR